MTAPLNSADAVFARHLAACVPEGTLMPAPPAYLEEPRRKMQTPRALLARPRNTAEAAAIVAACAAARVGIIPWGGGTGLVGGQVMPDGPVPLILSLERMTTIRGIFPDEGVLVAEAGVILTDVQDRARGVSRLFPLTLASQGSARVGGLLSTNAGGVNVLRYGNARDLCLGVEAVLPDGSIFNGLKRLRKDNTGYDIRNLLIGAEGTLGVITAASLRLHPIPASIGTAVLTVASAKAALSLLALAQERMAGCVSVFELIHRQGLLFLDETLPEVRQPFATRPEWMVLIEVGLPQGIDADAALEGLFSDAVVQGLADDGIIAQNHGQTQDFWRLREALPAANKRVGAISSHDIALPLTEIPEFLDRAAPAIRALGDFRINCFGHLGDGNLHYNVFPPKGGQSADHANRAPEIKTTVHDLVAALGGSFSAEHGVGRFKVADLEKYGDPAKLATMRAIKAALDPTGIMNPGAVLEGGA